MTKECKHLWDYIYTGFFKQTKEGGGFVWPVLDVFICKHCLTRHMTYRYTSSELQKLPRQLISPDVLPITWGQTKEDDNDSQN
jgi:hypothetical protein